MSTGLVVAANDPAAALAAVRRGGRRVIRWPDDGPLLIEQQWDRIGGCLDALTGQTGVRRLAPDEAAALPGVPIIALMLDLIADSDTGLALDSGPSVLIGDPAAITGVVSTLSHLTYGQRRLLPMPLDLLAAMNRKLGAIAAVAPAISMSEELLRRMRTRGEWAALVLGDTAQSQRAARHLALAGMALLPAQSTIEQALRGTGDSSPVPWLDITRRGAEYELRLPVTGVCKEAVALSRAGDYLVVTVDGLAHPIELPSGLKRCVITEGRVDDDGLRIRFSAEKELWRE